MENYIIQHCAPTLAGLKTSNMFSIDYDSIETLNNTILNINNKLNYKGVYFKILRTCNKKSLIYVYRKNKLLNDISTPEVFSLLNELGYNPENLDTLLGQLSTKLRQSNSFPHEIGLFLGYPVEDVIGFINNKGKNHCFCGYWKVYGNVEETKKLFDKYKKCISVYHKRFIEGFSLTHLTVAA